MHDFAAGGWLGVWQLIGGVIYTNNTTANTTTLFGAKIKIHIHCHLSFPGLLFIVSFCDFFTPLPKASMVDSAKDSSFSCAFPFQHYDSLKVLEKEVCP